MSRGAERFGFYCLGLSTWAAGAVVAWVFLNHKPFQN